MEQCIVCNKGFLDGEQPLGRCDHCGGHIVSRNRLPFLSDRFCDFSPKEWQEEQMRQYGKNIEFFG